MTKVAKSAKAAVVKVMRQFMDRYARLLTAASQFDPPDDHAAAEQQGFFTALSSVMDEMEDVERTFGERMFCRTCRKPFTQSNILVGYCSIKCFNERKEVVGETDDGEESL